MKLCSKCGETKPFADFYKSNTKPTGYQSQCKVCGSTTSREHYNKSSPDWKKDKVAKTAEMRKINRAYLSEVKKLNPCTCGESTGVCLDFHHVSGTKEFAVSRGANNVSITKLREELIKCVVLCANCHRKLHGGVAIQINDIVLP